LVADKARFVHLFNLGFRKGANDRAAAGLEIAAERTAPHPVPPVPAECARDLDRKAWVQGYVTGYKLGASDAELASVDIPGAHGMISGFDEDFLAQFNFFGWLEEGNQ
jgi:hypothetical protein